MYFNDNITDKMGFNLVADAYDDARPHYPEVLYTDALNTMGINDKNVKIDRVLEIGSGSGQATKKLTQWTQRLDCIEPGHHFAAQLRKKFKNTAVSIYEQGFESFETDDHYDLIASACALHWIPKATAYRKITELLKPGGWLLAVWNQPRFTEEIDELIHSVFHSTLPDFSIPNCSQKERDFFEEGYNDFLARGFIDGYHHIYTEPRTLSSQTLINLIWSYVSPIHLSEHTRSKLHNQLTKAVDNLANTEHELTNFFPLAMGQWPGR